MATVVLAGTLDTKGNEYAFVKQCIEEMGVDTFVIDTSILGNSPFAPDISSEKVVERTGKKLQDLRFTREGSDTRAVAIDAMSQGLSIVLNDLVEEGRCDGVFGMGGSGGTNLISAAMATLPIGIPKLILSTMMSGDVRPYVGTKDITMMYSVTDIAGLNNVSRRILANAAHAIGGMAKYNEGSREKAGGDNKPLIAISMFGVTTPGVLKIIDLLEQKEFETIIFHSTGSGGLAMENMIREGLIDGVVDYTLAELCDYEFGGAFSAGPTRLTAASDMNIPQVVVPGAIEVLNYNGVDNIPPENNVPERKLIVHNPTVCAVKATNEELEILGKIVGEKLNRADGNVEVILPLGGLDSYEAAGGPWEDKESDKVLFDAIKSTLNPDVPIQEIDANINDKTFAEVTVNTFVNLWNGKDE